MTSEVFEVFLDNRGLFSGGRRPAFKPQLMDRTGPPPERKEHTAMATVTAAITAPCGTCAHEAICNRKLRLAGLGRALEAQVPGGIEGISFSLRATIECDAYMRGRGGTRARSEATTAAGEAAVGAETPRRQISEAGREAMRESGRRLGELRRQQVPGNVIGEPIRELETAGAAG